MNRNKLSSHILAVDIASRYGADAAITSQFVLPEGESQAAAIRHAHWRVPRAEQLRAVDAALPAMAVMPDRVAAIKPAPGK